MPHRLRRRVAAAAFAWSWFLVDLPGLDVWHNIWSVSR